MSAIERAVEIAKSQQALAETLGVTQSLISQWVNGDTAIHSRHFQGISDATDGQVTPAELLADEMAKIEAKKKRRPAARGTRPRVGA